MKPLIIFYMFILVRCNINEDSSMLWNRRLGHISIDRIKKLVKDGALSTLDYTNLETCVDCIRENRQTSLRRMPT